MDLSLGTPAQAAFGLVAGLLIGVTHFALLRWNTRLFVTGCAGRAVALQVGRIAVTVTVLTLLVRLSLVTLLFGALGVLIARPLLLRRLGALP